jgi:hypothetical protein
MCALFIRVVVDLSDARYHFSDIFRGNILVNIGNFSFFGRPPACGGRRARAARQEKRLGYHVELRLKLLQKVS